MAAWSDTEDVGGFSQPKRVEVTIERLSTPDATPSTEPFPEDVWTFFSDSDLDQLVVDACAEMGRRELGRKS